MTTSYAREDRDVHIIRVGELTLNLHTRTVTCRRRPVHLQPRLYQLLLYLMQHTDKVISAEEIIRSVWRKPTIKLGTVRAYVPRLRKALWGKSSVGKERIQVVMNEGYRLNTPIEYHI